MARQKAQGKFIVTPYQAEPGAPVPGLEFASATAANEFAKKMHKVAVRLWGKLNNIPKEEYKKKKTSLGTDVVLQPTDAQGNPVGVPMLWETIGISEAFLNGESEPDTSDSDDEEDDD